MAAAVSETPIAAAEVSEGVTTENEAIQHEQQAALREELKKVIQERDMALQQLHEFQQGKDFELASIATKLQTMEKSRATSHASTKEMQREKATLNQRVQDLEARVHELTQRCQQNEVQAGAAKSLKSQLQEVETKLKKS